MRDDVRHWALIIPLLFYFQMVMYSLGMTFYWCVDYHLPQNQVPSFYFHPLFVLFAWCSYIVHSAVCTQPVELSSELEGLLLSMCEDIVVRRTNLLTVLETCELHHKASMLSPPEQLIRQLVEEVYRNSVSI